MIDWIPIERIRGLVIQPCSKTFDAVELEPGGPIMLCERDPDDPTKTARVAFVNGDAPMTPDEIKGGTRFHATVTGSPVDSIGHDIRERDPARQA